MSKFSLAVATVLSLSAGTVMAQSVPITQQMQIASAQIDIRGSHELRDRRLLAGGGGEYLGTTGAHATQLANLDQEPESINRGTEP
jgi:hypothetical protein